jgi:hypothetical protein
VTLVPAVGEDWVLYAGYIEEVVALVGNRDGIAYDAKGLYLMGLLIGREVVIGVYVLLKVEGLLLLALGGGGVDN